MAVAERGDRLARDVLHHEVRPAGVGGAGVEARLATLGWSISASACRSASKRATTSRVSMPSLISLSATRAADGLRLLGLVDDAHAAFAE